MSYFRTLGPRLLAQGYTIVPIPRGSKGPRLDDWRNLHLQASTFEEWCKGTWTKVTDDGERQIPNTRDTDGVGINTTGNPAVDVDEYDEAIVKQVQAFMSDNLDAVGPRRIGKAPKSLFLFRTDTPFAKIQSSTWKDSKGRACKCEILGDGQQFVAYHIHPDTLKPYVWPEEWESPVDVAAADLPVLTEVAAKAICSFYDKLCSEAGRSKVSDASSGGDDSGEALAREAPPPETDYEITRVKKALDHISADCSRSEYLAVLAGLKWTGWMCSEEVAHEWAEKSEEGKFDERDFQRDWRSLEGERIGKRTTTLGSVISMAVKAGFDASRKDEPKLSVEEAKNVYEEIAARIAAVGPDDRAELKAIVKAIAESGLDALDAGALLKTLSKATKVSIGDLKQGLREVKEAGKKDREHGEPTHGNYAKQLLDQYEEDYGAPPKNVEGKMWVFNKDTGLWVGRDVERVTVDVVKHFDGMENVFRRNDYVAVSKQAMAKASVNAETFFEDAPRGMACEGRFYFVEGGEIQREPLVASHRQRVNIKIAPRVMDTPLWDKLMATAFDGDNNREQELLLEEFIGGALIGVTQRFEKVLLMKGVGRSGKGTILKIISALVPKAFISSTPPDRWNEDYHLAMLAGARINIVGELSDENPIDGAAFKTVVGRDEMVARLPAQPPFTFTCQAAHIFNSNYFIPTRDHTEAFYARWILIEFRNSMLDRAEGDTDPRLAEKIIEGELPGIAARFLKGAKRLVERGHFEMTPQHYRLMSSWQHRASTLMEFITDPEAVVVRSDLKMKRADFFSAYCHWCRESNRKPLGKHKLYDEMDRSRELAKMGIVRVNHAQIQLIRGLALRSSGFDVEWSEGEDDY